MYLYINTAVAGLNSRCGLIDDKGIFMVLPKIFIIWWHYIINQDTSTAFTYHRGCGLLLSFMDSIRRYNTQAWVIITCRYCAHMQLYMYMQIYTGTHYLCVALDFSLHGTVHVHIHATICTCVLLYCLFKAADCHGNTTNSHRRVWSTWTKPFMQCIHYREVSS